MITLSDVHKRYWTSRGEPHWVLRGVSVAFPSDRNVGVIGVNGAGKSTLLRLISGVDLPTRGEVRCDSRVSWPLGLTGGLQRMLSGRQNARFICRVHGFESELEERVRFVHEFSELGEAFDEPIWSYSSGMRARLNFTLSLAFDFDMYLIDELMSVGDAKFRQKSTKAIRDLINRAGVIIVSHSEGTIRSFCHAVIWLHEGRAIWYDSPKDAIRDYKRHFLA
ncbi:MAG: polysaccharide/polyol phosphate ABC transporter ATP-binding protein [Betaproteobacteria bacterium RIFCSPLOWO2_12_FULL_65_14]|nr:MAG: polysaccharide/polyol phosphate ABC transporter ATP-binding protein [Betaproteobacteria bacterium RIFCSPLOWO2_12_FULL_65_14]